MNRLWSRLYDKISAWARHRRAPSYLMALSFAESSFFPVPPDVLLAPMTLAEPRKGWRYAALTTVASVVGGLFGYVIGLFALEAVQPLLHAHGYWPAFERARDWFEHWGFWAVLIAGFTPVPYKVFTLSAGAAAMPLLPFFGASLVGRGVRFFLVVALMVWGGQAMSRMPRRYINGIGWLSILVAVLVVILRS